MPKLLRILALSAIIGCSSPPRTTEVQFCESQAGAEQQLPVSRVDPPYPRQALHDQIEGYVDIKARIGPQGEIQDPVVVDSKPPGAFERSALEAFSQFRYCVPERPGEPIQVRLEFALGGPARVVGTDSVTPPTSRDSRAPVRRDYADSKAGVYFELPPGWIFLSPAAVDAMVGRFASGWPARPHFAAVREATREMNYPDGLVVFSFPPVNEADAGVTLSEVCSHMLRNAPIVDGEHGTHTRLFAENQQFCAMKPDPNLGLEGTLYMLIGRAGLIFVMTFAPTSPVETKIEEALSQLRFEPR